MVELIGPEAIHLITEGIKAIRHLCLIGSWETTHGQHHWARVACMAEVIRINTPGHMLEMPDVVVPALLHDLGRVDDSGDPEHGLRGAKPAAKALTILEESGLALLDPVRWGATIDIVIHHCEQIPGLFLEGSIVRDADILDLYRDPNREVKTDRLRTLLALAFIGQAKTFSKSEWEFNDGHDNT